MRSSVPSLQGRGQEEGTKGALLPDLRCRREQGSNSGDLLESWVKSREGLSDPHPQWRALTKLPSSLSHPQCTLTHTHTLYHTARMHKQGATLFHTLTLTKAHSHSHLHTFSHTLTHPHPLTQPHTASYPHTLTHTHTLSHALTRPFPRVVPGTHL